MIPGGEAHIIVRSHDVIHLMINNFTNVTLAHSDTGLYVESTLYKHIYKMAGSYDLQSADETNAEPNDQLMHQ